MFGHKLHYIVKLDALRRFQRQVIAQVSVSVAAQFAAHNARTPLVKLSLQLRRKLLPIRHCELHTARAEGIRADGKAVHGYLKHRDKQRYEYELDLAIVEGRIADPNIHYLLLDTDYLVLAVSVNHPFAKRSMVTLNELKKERMILRLPDSNTRNLFVAHLESNNMSISDFNVVLEIDNMATIKDLIRRDFGVSILARSVCLDELKKGKIAVLPVENLSMMREINIAYHNDFTQFDVLHDIMKVYNETLRIYA